jgi:hypothetical protein
MCAVAFFVTSCDNAVVPVYPTTTGTTTSSASDTPTWTVPTSLNGKIFRVRTNLVKENSAVVEEYTFFSFSSATAGTMTPVTATTTQTGGTPMTVAQSDTSVPFTYNETTGALTYGTNTYYFAKGATTYAAYFKDYSFTRSSGSGLYATWSHNSITVVATSTGSYTYTDSNGTYSGTIANDSGIVVVPYEDESYNVAGVYDGTYIYGGYPMTVVKSVGDVTTADTVETVTSNDYSWTVPTSLNGKIFKVDMSSSSWYLSFTTNTSGVLYEYTDGTQKTNETFIYNETSGYAVCGGDAVYLAKGKTTYAVYNKTSGIFTRSSGSGIYGTWKYNTTTLTFTSSNTFTAVDDDGTTVGTFTNDSGIVVLNPTSNRSYKVAGVYDGTYVYEGYPMTVVTAVGK